MRDIYVTTYVEQEVDVKLTIEQVIEYLDDLDDEDLAEFGLMRTRPTVRPVECPECGHLMSRHDWHNCLELDCHCASAHLLNRVA